MIKILHVIDKLSMDGINPSSCTILLGDWAESFDPDRFQIEVCTLRNPDPAGQYLESKNVQVNYLGFGKISPANVVGIVKLLRQGKHDIVHLHGYSAANFGRIASKIVNIPNIVHEHAVLQVQSQQYVADKLLSRLTGTAVAVSKDVKDFMVQKRSVPEHKIRVLSNGINLTKYKTFDDSFTRNKRSELGIRPEQVLAGTVTRLREEKGNEYLIERYLIS